MAPTWSKRPKESVTSAGKAIESEPPKDNGDGSYECAFTPPAAGLYTITVRIGGLDVKGTPFCVAIGEGEGSDGSDDALADEKTRQVLSSMSEQLAAHKSRADDLERRLATLEAASEHE